MRWLLPAALAAALPAAAQVPAQPAPPASPPQAMPEAQAAQAAAFENFTKTPAYRSLLSQALARVPQAVLGKCPKPALSPVAVQLMAPLRFAPDKSLIGGSWRDSQLVRGCGPEVQINAFFFATPQRRTMIVLGVPGTSRADLAQQRDARTYALVALDGRCNTLETVDTRFEGWGNKWPELADPGEGAPFRPWWEIWTMAGCGKRWDVPLDFRPNRLGTQIIQPGNVQERRAG